MPDLRCMAISSTMSVGTAAFVPCKRRPITSISGIRVPAASPVLRVCSNDSMVIVSISPANRCFVFADTGIFATKSPFGSVAFSAGIAVEFGRPNVSAETEPQEAIVIVGLLSLLMEALPRL